MTAIQRFALHGTIMNPHSHGPYVRHEDHLAAMQGRCLAHIEEPAGAAPAAVSPRARDLLGIVRTAQAEARRLINGEDSGSDLAQTKLDLPETLRVLEHALSQPVAAAPALEAPAAPDCEQLDAVARKKLGVLLNAFGEAQWQAGRGVPCPSIEDAFEAVISAAVDLLAAAPQAPAAPVPWVGPVRELLGHLSDVLGDEAFAKIDTARWNAVSALIGAAAAPAAPAVDESFEDLMSNWAHGDALDAEYYRTLSQAARDVLAERRRQVCAEGYEPEADEMYQSGELARAAATYALLATGDDGWRVEDNWPRGMSTLKRAEPRRMLEKAGALILADMERIDRAAQAKEGGEA